MHVAWSGDHTTYAERTPEGECLLGGGELLGPGRGGARAGGDVRRARGWSAPGPAPGSTRPQRPAARLAAPALARAPGGTRPVLVNTWEAVYFDHDLGPAHRAGRGRRRGRRGAVRARRRLVPRRGARPGRAGRLDGRPERLAATGCTRWSTRCKRLGMDFGLWVEPEMVNEDSDLARAHPDWVLRGRGDLPPGVAAPAGARPAGTRTPTRTCADALLALLDGVRHRLPQVGPQPRPRSTSRTPAGRPCTGRPWRSTGCSTSCATAHPDLEIETCASGGGRIDLEVLTRTDRVWPSDTIDAVERQRIQRWTSLLVPPEMLGAHLGGPVAHTTGRTPPDSGSAPRPRCSATSASSGTCAASDAEDRAEVAAWVALHKQVRPLVAERPAGARRPPRPGRAGHRRRRRGPLRGVVRRGDGRHPADPVASAPVRLPGLDPDRQLPR